MSTFAGNKQLELVHREKKIDGASQLPQQLALGRQEGTRRSNLELPNLQHSMGQWGKGLLILTAYKKDPAGTQGSQLR